MGLLHKRNTMFRKQTHVRNMSWMGLVCVLKCGLSARLSAWQVTHTAACVAAASATLHMQVLGTDDFYEYLSKYGLQLDPQLENLVGQHTKKPWAKFINADNEHLVSDEAIDFLDKILCYDHQKRLTCQEAMAHPYFDPVRDEIMAQATEPQAAVAAV